MKTRILLLIAVLISTFSFAQDSTQTAGWDLQECIKVALENNLGVRRSVYNIRNYEIGLFQSKMALLPTVNFSGSYGKGYGRSLNPVSNLYINRNTDNINVQANSSLTLFNGFKLQNAIRQSQRDYDASNEDLKKAKNDVIISVSTLYINVIFNQELYENAKYQLASSQAQLDRIVKQVAAGALPKSDQLNQEAQVATNEVNLINQENALNLSMLQLKQAMQVPASSILTVVVPVLAAEDLILDQNAEEIYAIALSVMPEIKSSLLKAESAEMALKASKGSLYPRISFNASAQSNYSSASNRPIYELDGGTQQQQIGYTQSNEPVYTTVPTASLVSNSYGEKDQLQDNLFKQLSVGITIPIFNGWQTRSAVQRAAVNKELADISIEQTKNTLRQTIETSYNDALAASKTYTSSLKQVSAREEAYRMVQHRFEIGAVNYVEYQIAENTLFQAKSDLARAKYNFIFRKKILDLYQGKTIEF